MSVTSCDLFSPGLGDAVDKGLPVVGIESHGNGTYVGGTITLSGYATDDLEVKNVKVSHGSQTFTADLSGETWSLEMDTSLFTDGDLELTITAVDTSDKSVSINVLLIVDNSPPSVMVTTPTEYNDYGDLLDPDDDEIVSFNKNITIKGEAADTTRVKKVYVSFYKESDDSVVIDHAEATGTSSWYYIFDSTAFHLESDPAEYYYFVITAEDYSGNVSTFFYHFDDINSNLGSYYIEQINASDNEGATIAGLSDLRLSASSDPRMEIEIDPDSDAPQFTIISPAEDATTPSDNIFSSPQRFSGFVEDDDLAGIDESTLTLTITDWDDSSVMMTAVYGVDGDFTMSGNQWTFEASLVDGEYGIQLTADDAGGKTGTSSLVPFKVSSFAPVVSVDTPQQGVYIGKDSTTSFTVSVIGAAGDEVYIDLDDSGTYDVDEQMSGTGGTYTLDVTEGSSVFSLAADGDDIFQIRAGVDPNYGTATLQYTGDITDPTVDFSYPAEGQSVNGLITISGTASDNYVIGEVYVLITDESDWSALSTDYTNDWITPTGTYNWNISDYDTSALVDGGTYYLYVKAFDDAGNGSDLSLPDASIGIIIDQESDRPVIDLSNMVEGGSGNGLAQDASIIGIIRDDDTVDASTLEIRVDINNDGIYDGIDLNEDLDKLDANESEDWVAILPGADADDDAAILSWSYSLENVPQGTHSMQIRVHDTVSDGVTFDEGTNPNYAELAVTEFIIDYGPPTLTITSPANGAIFNSSFTIEGTASDANNVTDVEISFDAGSTYTSLYSDATGIEVVNWSHSFTVNADGTTDDDYSYQIRATDYSGGVTTRDRQLIVDATAPTITFEQPPELKTVNGTEVEIKGTADDNRSISAIYISIDPEGTDPAADVTTWDTVDSGIYSWSHTMDSTAYNNTETPENYVISLAAVDTAGNATGYLGYQRTVVVDQSSDRPVISFNDIDKDETDAANNVLVGANTLSGVIEDDDSIDPALFSGDSIEISIDGGAWEAVSNPPSSSSTLVVWRHDISSYGEGAHTVSVRARDSLSDGTVGASSVSAEYSSDFNWAIEDSSDQGGIPFILNVGPPSITVDNPVPYSYHNSDVTIDGTAVDANGVSDVDISFDNGSTWEEIVITPSTSVSWSYVLSVNSDGSDDDTYSYIVRGTDDYGSTALESGQFTVDTTGPVMSISTPGDGETVNGYVNLSGTATELYSIDQVVVGLDGNGDGDVSDAGDVDWTLALGTYAWSYELDSTSIADNTYDLYVRGRDQAGNWSAVNATCSFTVDQSSDRPTINLGTLTEAGTAEENLLPGSLQISGTVTDDDSVDSASIEIRIDENNDGDYDDGGQENWSDITGLPANDGNVVTWSHTFSGLTDGQYNFEMRAGDVSFADNYSDPYKAASIGPIDFSVDTALPAGAVSFPSQGAYLNNDGTGEITIYGTASDASGIKSVEVSVDGGAALSATGTTSWSYDYTIGSDGQVSYQILITDNYDKIYTIDRYFTVDTTAPEPVYTQPGAGETVNGSLVVRGTTTEENLVSAVYFWLGADGDTVPSVPADPTVITDWTDAGWTHLSGTFSWSERINTTLYADGLHDVYVYSVDNAGNLSSPAVLEDIDIDQTTDDPVITVNSLASAPTVNQFGTGGTISGNITDDDSVDASTIQISFDGGSTWTDVSSQGTDGTSVNWSHDLSSVAESGTAYNVMVQASDVGDTANGIPVRTVSVPATPYAVAVDRNLPALTVDSIDYVDRYDASALSVTGGSMSGALINNNFTVTVSASDASGIAEIAVSEDGGAFGTADVTDNGDGTWTYSVTVDVAGGGDDGTKSFIFRATDTWDKETAETLAVVIDTTEPTLSYLEPAEGANVNGDVTVRGTTFDVSALDSLTMTAGLGDSVSLANGGTLSSWTSTFDAYAYDEATYATDNGDGTWAFPLNVTSYDAAGNRTIASRTVNLDPEGDKPVIVTATVQPGVTESPYTDSVSISGTIVMQSSVTDDDSPSYVLVYADLNDDGDYDDDYAYDLNSDLDTTDAFETEGNPLEVTVTNGVWTALLNENSEFGLTTMTNRGVAGPTGYMRFFMVPYDINDIAGDPVVCRIYIDASAPEISGLNLSNGELVRGDGLSLTGTIQDDAELDTASDIKISFDGGTTYEALSVTQTGSIPYVYTFDRSIDTTDYYADGDSGILNVAIQVSDETYKQTNYSLALNVDNSRPTVTWNNPSTLPYLGTPPDEVYDFFGDNDTADSQNQLFGSAVDSGLVSGIEKVNVYFVKDSQFINPSDGSLIAVSSSNVYNQSDTEDSIPFTEDADYVITIDNRLEQGQFDQTTDIGDFDGYQESLKSRVGYDEWYAFFDTFDISDGAAGDGPVDIYMVAYDEAGNTSYSTAHGQISNNPPEFDQILTGSGAPGSIYDGLFKTTNTLYIDADAIDAEGIDTSTYKATLTAKVEAPNGDATSSGPALGTEYAMDTNGVLSIDMRETPTTDYVSGVQYTFTVEVYDTDGNIVTEDIDVWLNNSDSVVPKVDIDDFTQDHLSGLSGHLEEDGSSLIDGTDADVSGTILVTGTAWDDNTVSSIELSLDGGANWVAVDSFSITSSDLLLGNDYEWSYEWDTTADYGSVTENAAYNRTIMIRATDGNSNVGTLAEGSVDPTLSVDVVPYVTGITGTGFDSGLLTYVRRSATGRYPISSGATITITGYNLPGTGAGAVSIGGTALTGEAGSDTEEITVDLTGISTSGDIEVTTNSVASSNNSNDDTLSQNKEASTYNTALTDDREAVFWSVAAVSGTSTVTDPTMKPNAAGDGFDWMYVASGNQIYLLPEGGSSTLITEGTGLSGGDFTYNEDGKLVFIFNHDAQWTFVNNSYAYTGSVQYGLIPDLSSYVFDVDGTEARDESYNWNNSLGFVKLGLGNVSFTDSIETLPFTDYGYSQMDLNRYENLKLRTIGDGTVGDDSVNRNYVAYFDKGAGESRSIVFYAFQTGDSAADVSSSQQLYQNETLLSAGTDVTLNTDNIGGTVDWYANIDKYYETNGENDTVALAGTQTKNDSGIATPRGRQEVTTADSGNDSSQFDLAVYEETADTRHYGFIAYFDETAQSLKITANESLYNADPTGALGTWTAAQTIDTNAGADVAMAVDEEGGIHLAYQDVSSGYLKYSYLTFDDGATSGTYEGDESFTVVRQVYVDALFGAGSNNSITIKDFDDTAGTDYRPVIMTFSSAYTGTKAPLRLSYPLANPADGGFGAGADSSTGAFLGNWETVALPADSAPEDAKSFLYLDSSGNAHLGYDASTLEEATFLGF